MKINLLILLFSAAFLNCSAQDDVANFFRNEGVPSLATFAHPTDTYENGSYSVYDDYVIVDIHYAWNYHTKLKVYRGGPFQYNGVEVLEDNDFVPPFAAVQLMMSLAMEEARKHQAEYSRVENYLVNLLGKQTDEWNGADWALCLLIIDNYSSALSGNNSN